ncbi:hypothetical protein QVD99_003363 [Batrachochytrium dendrobatidis]|nr:hypothetical protein QVD99_003363 [Batrachochytrium dendrobatidis]
MVGCTEIPIPKIYLHIGHQIPMDSGGPGGSAKLIGVPYLYSSVYVGPEGQVADQTIRVYTYQPFGSRRPKLGGGPFITQPSSG